jgi:hypothetical protein
MMRLDLPQPLKPGGKYVFSIDWSYNIGDRMVDGERSGYEYFPDDKNYLYTIAQWFPRMCVYDDSRGWDTLPFLVSGEFYLEYGDIDYEVTVPWDMIVAGSGELINPGEVLTPTQISRLNIARNSDKTVMIRNAGEIGDPASRPVRKGTLTWHFKMFNTRDVAFGASKVYIRDAARVNLPDGKKSLAMSVYPIESAGGNAWGRLRNTLKNQWNTTPQNGLFTPTLLRLTRQVWPEGWNTRVLYLTV